MNRVWYGSRYVELRGADDGLSHRVAESAYTEGTTSGTGRYKTLCGRSVLATTLIMEPGPVCRACSEAQRTAM